MAYKIDNGRFVVGTRLVTVRIRRDLLEKMEMLCINRSRIINILFEDYLREVDHGASINL